MLAPSLAAPQMYDLKLDIEAISIVAPGGHVEAASMLCNVRERIRLAAALGRCGPGCIPALSELELPRQLARSSGVSRASSAPRATVYACLASKAALDRVEHPYQTTAVIALSTTAGLDAALRHELSGLERGWETVDPFLLPYAIPSAMATQVARVCGAKEGAICMSDGFYSFPQSLVLSAAYLSAGVQRVIIVAAEQVPKGIMQAMAHVGTCDIMEGAIAFIVRQSVDMPSRAVRVHVHHSHTNRTAQQSAPSLETIGTSMDDMLSICGLISSLSEVPTTAASLSIRSRSDAFQLFVASHG